MTLKRPALVRTKEYVWCQNGDYVGLAFFFKFILLENELGTFALVNVASMQWGTLVKT